MSSALPLHLHIEISGDIGRPVAHVRVVGEFDRSQTVRFDDATRALPPAVRLVEVDLTGTTIIDSAAIGSLIRLRHRLDDSDGRLSVIVRPNFQHEVLTIGGVAEYLNASVRA